MSALRLDSGSTCAGLRPGLGRGGMIHSLVVLIVGRSSCRELDGCNSVDGPATPVSGFSASLGGIV